jgi:ferritin-like metal-binding protein YciE
MAIQSPKDLFIHELEDIFDAEQRISKMLPLMANECNNPQVKSAFEQHQQETLEQITNLEECFKILGIKPKTATCAAVAGLKQEHDSFLKEKPSEDVLTMFDLGGAAKTEYYEMASYKGLIEKAQLMGQQQCVNLLQQNLSQEEAMAKRVETLSKQLGKQMIPQAR